jgi:hypothetical protein
MTEPKRPEYGVVSCGKLAPGPLAHPGPCRREPGHDGPCTYQYGNGLVAIAEGPPPLPAEAEAEAAQLLAIMRQDRRRIRRSMRIVMVCALVSFVCAGYAVLRALEILVL